MTAATSAEGRDSARYCGGKKRQGEGYCTRPSGWGTAHPGAGRCKLHGGSTPTQTIAVERRQVEDGARRILADLGAAEPVDNPLLELQRLAGEILAFRNALRAMVQQLGEAIRYEGKAGEQLRAEVALYERALDRCARVLVDIGRLNIDSRLAAISEKQAESVVAALMAGLAAAGIRRGSEQDLAARAAVVKGLRAISAQPPVACGTTRDVPP